MTVSLSNRMTAKSVWLAGFAIIFVLLFVLSPMPAGSPQSASATAPDSSLTPSSFAFTINGTGPTASNMTLTAYQAWTESWNVTGATNYLYHQPTGFQFLQYCYQNCGNLLLNSTLPHLLINVEVYQFANATAALHEFQAQYPYKWSAGCMVGACPPGSPSDRWGPIFRFDKICGNLYGCANQQLAQRSDFMFLFYAYDTKAMIAWNFVNSYINDIFGVIPGDAAPSPPPANIPASIPQWGLREGDNLTWNVQSSGCSGTVESGGTCSSHSSDVNLHIIAVADGGRAIEVMGPSQYGWPSDFNEGGTFNYYAGVHPGSLPTQSYTWINGSAPLSRGSSFPLLFPVYSSESALEASMKSSTPATDFTSDGVSITGTYSTAYTSGVPSLLIENVRIVEHMGSGVVTSVSFNYDNQQTGVTASVSLGLKGANFDLNSRETSYTTTTTCGTCTTTPGPTTITTFTSSSTIPSPPPQPDYTMYAVAAAAAVVLVVAAAFHRGRGSRHPPAKDVAPSGSLVSKCCWT